MRVLENCEPVYETFPGWQQPTSEIRSYQDLPADAKSYLDVIKNLTQTDISIISVGSGREQTILMD